MEKKKTRWNKPGMIVLTRSKDGGAVLDYCKGGTGTGPAIIFGQCVRKTWGAGREVCSTRPCAFNVTDS